MYENGKLGEAKFVRDIFIALTIALVMALISALSAPCADAATFNNKAKLDTRQVQAGKLPARFNPDVKGQGRGWACVTGWADDLTRQDKLRYMVRRNITLGATSHVLTVSEKGAVNMVRRDVKLKAGEMVYGACKYAPKNRAQYLDGEIWNRAQLALANGIEPDFIVRGALKCGVKAAQANAWTVHNENDDYVFATKAQARKFVREYGEERPMTACRLS